jgi:K+-transporting ATPase ATPase A chain
MKIEGWILIFVFVGLVALIARPMGLYLAAVFDGRRTWLSPVLAPLERGFYRLGGVKQDNEQDWKGYAASLVMFSLFATLALFAFMQLQHVLPLNPQGFGPVAPNVAMNTAVSFVTNTNWQAYSGESTMSHLTQMAGLTVQNFLSAAAGIAVAVVFARGFARRGTGQLGNFWVDMTRATLYVLLPISILFAIYLMASGVPQTLAGSLSATTLEGVPQDIAIGPVASQEAIKMLGTNGGGFFNANSAHPFENPNPWTNLVQMLSIFSIGAGLVVMFGRMVGDERQGWAILAAMGALFLIGTGVAYWSETQVTPALMSAGVDPSLGNMEGKEVRFGLSASALFAAVTTAASCGAVNAMHDSFTAIGGMIPLVNILAGEVIVGGVGAGFYGILLFAILAIFIAGLMVGRTPAYLGKKIEAREVKLAVLAILASPLAILIGTAIAASQPMLAAQAYSMQDRTVSPRSCTRSPRRRATMARRSLASRRTRTSTLTPMRSRCWSVASWSSSRRSPSPAVLRPSRQRRPRPGPSRPMARCSLVLLAFVIVVVGALTFLPALAVGPVAEATANTLN